jgi:transporter family-2 protein
MGSAWVYIAWSAFAGATVPVMAAMTGTLGRSLQSPLHGALISVVVCAAAVAALVAALRPATPAAATLAAVPPWAFLAGLGMAIYALSATFVTPRFGVGNFVLCVVLAQLVVSSLIDQFGLFGAPLNPIGLKRAAGLALLAAGASLVALR